MEIVIQNANILIDLVKTELVHLPFLLGANFTISELVFDGLHKSQKNQFDQFLKNGELSFGHLSPEEYSLICRLVGKYRQLSPEDFSGLLIAKQKKGFLLTDCKHSTNLAEQFTVTPIGILWILDKLIEINKITTLEAYAFLYKLMEANKRMAKDECKKKLESWALVST